MSSNSTSSNSTQGVPFAVIDANDQGGLLWITAALSFSYFMLSSAIRVFISYGSFHRDSAMLVVATVFGLAQVMTVFAQLSSGFGTSVDLLDPSQLPGIQKAAYASDIFFILTLSCSKCSVAWFIARLNPNARHGILCSSIFWTSVVWGLVGILALALRCNLSYPWITIGEQCTNLFLRWQIIIAFDIITEIALLSLTIYLVWDLQMARQRKFIVVLGFAFRLPLIVLAILHARYIAVALNSANQTLDGIPASILEEIQLGWSLISATIPCLKSFVVNLGTGFMGGGTLDKTIVNSRGYAVGSNSYVMDTISVSQQARSKVTAGHPETMSNRTLTRASHDEPDDAGIRMTVDYHIGYEQR